MEPEGQGNLLPTTLGGPETLRPSGLVDLNAGPDDQNQEEHIKEVLPAQPCRDPHRSTFRILILAGIPGNEILRHLSAQEELCGNHRHRSDNNRGDEDETQGSVPLLPGQGPEQVVAQRELLLQILSLGRFGTCP